MAKKNRPFSRLCFPSERFGLYGSVGWQTMLRDIAESPYMVPMVQAHETTMEHHAVEGQELNSMIKDASCNLRRMTIN